ncbi:uncharacterized protein LOC123271358 [Cotesia glomerata]|uniref:Calcium signal-modulating cyclophilin ligand n=1 Tax=Cotesia glomerata TaxID=32391 RepID=A0AAV7IRM7_COTGL|nr:uncharacterized protein LOC123271358 [Cotesia glomerata]KAH0557229.1 hypothetical protein KQX54_002006 [Cotesia glomerata]
MADAAAKREARRRRILENSESRFQKISGRDTSDDIGNGISQEFFVEPAEEIVLPNLSNQDNCDFVSPVSRSTSYNSSEPVNPEELANLLRGTIGSTKPPKKPSLLNNFLFNRFIYAVLALIINFLIILKIDSPVGKSVITPFLLLLLPRVYILTTQENSPQENMMYAVLMLCNIRPSLISKLKNSYKIWSLVVDDFNIYIFSFVMFYFTITRHFIDYEEELAKLETVQVIIDPST